jgi:hypothetical protein
VGIRHRDVEVRISRRTLWVDTQVYPLAHVTRVQPLEFKPRRGRVLRAYGREAGAWLGLGFIGLVFIGCLGNAVPPAAVTVYEILLLTALVAVSVRLIRRLTASPLHVLSIATSGSPHAAVASRDRDLIFDLAQRVVDAIDDPAMEYAIHVDHIDIKGDLVGGDKNGGDTVLGDKFATGG